MLASLFVFIPCDTGNRQLEEEIVDSLYNNDAKIRI